MRYAGVDYIAPDGKRWNVRNSVWRRYLVIQRKSAAIFFDEVIEMTDPVCGVVIENCHDLIIEGNSFVNVGNAVRFASPDLDLGLAK